MSEAEVAKRRAFVIVDHGDVDGQSIGDDSCMVGVKLGSSASGFASDNAFVSSLTALEGHVEQEEQEAAAKAQREESVAGGTATTCTEEGAAGGDTGGEGVSERHPKRAKKSSPWSTLR